MENPSSPTAPAAPVFAAGSPVNVSGQNESILPLNESILQPIPDKELIDVVNAALVESGSTPVDNATRVIYPNLELVSPVSAESPIVVAQETAPVDNTIITDSNLNAGSDTRSNNSHGSGSDKGSNHENNSYHGSDKGSNHESNSYHGSDHGSDNGDGFNNGSQQHSENDSQNDSNNGSDNDSEHNSNVGSQQGSNHDGANSHYSGSDSGSEDNGEFTVDNKDDFDNILNNASNSVDLINMQANNDNEIAANFERINTLENDIEILQGNLTSNSVNSDNLQTEIDATEEALFLQKSNVKTYDNLLELRGTLEVEIEEASKHVNDKVSNLKTFMEKYNQSVADKKEESIVLSAQKNVQTHENIITAANVILSNLQQKLITTNAELDGIDNESTLSKVKGYEDALNTSKTELESTQSTITDINAQILALNDEKNLISTRSNTLGANNVRIAARLEVMRLAALEEERVRAQIEEEERVAREEEEARVAREEEEARVAREEEEARIRAQEEAQTAAELQSQEELTVPVLESEDLLSTGETRRLFSVSAPQVSITGNDSLGKTPTVTVVPAPQSAPVTSTPAESVTESTAVSSRTLSRKAIAGIAGACIFVVAALAAAALLVIRKRKNSKKTLIPVTTSEKFTK